MAVPDPDERDEPRPSLLERLSAFLTREPEDREELLDLLRGAFERRLLDAVHVDRLNFGRVPTTQLNWRQPHEGNIVEFLFRARAFQSAAL